MPTSALYYPWMHFQDDNWVKLALLTWDSVARVRARDVDDRDSELVRQVKDETDLLKEILPSQNDLIEVAHSFEEVLDTLGDRVAARYGQNQRGWEEDRGVYSAPWINTGFSYAPDYLTWPHSPRGGNPSR